MARVLAAKAALGIRVDALQEWDETEDLGEDDKAALGLEARSRLERKLAAIEGKPLKSRGVAIGPNGVAATTQPKKWDIKEARKYNQDADGLEGDEAPAVEVKPQKKLIEEINDEVMKDEESEEAESQPDDPIDSDEAAVIEPPKSNGVNGVSSKDAKKAEKKRLKEQMKKEKAERKEARKAKRGERSGKSSSDTGTATLAAQLGLSVEKYQKKLRRGEIILDDDGTPSLISKKEAKKASANGDEGSSKKRKLREDDEPASKPEKKKKRKEKS